jgi:hypothetical protein
MDTPAFISQGKRVDPSLASLTIRNKVYVSARSSRLPRVFRGEYRHDRGLSAHAAVNKIIQRSFGQVKHIVLGPGTFR